MLLAPLDERANMPSPTYVPWVDGENTVAATMSFTELSGQVGFQAGYEGVG